MPLHRGIFYNTCIILLLLGCWSKKISYGDNSQHRDGAKGIKQKIIRRILPIAKSIGACQKIFHVFLDFIERTERHRQSKGKQQIQSNGITPTLNLLQVMKEDVEDKSGCSCSKKMGNLIKPSKT